MKTETRKFETKRTIGEIASEMPSAMTLFEDLKMDYCCGGSRTLKESCALAGVSVEKVVSELERLEADSARREDPPLWKDKTVAELIGHILEKHHAFTRAQWGRLKTLSAKVKVVHGGNHPELSRLDEIVNEMSEEMDGHMAKEEEQVFPYLKALEEAGGDKEGIPNPFEGGPLENHPLKVLMWEHGMTGEEWIEIRKITDDLTPPSGACMSYQSLFRALRELEEDLHRHVHLENNVLFQKAIDKGWLD